MSVAAPLGIFIPDLARQPVATVPVTVYGTWWNVSGHRIRQVLNRCGVAHRYLNVQADLTAKAVLRSVIGDAVGLPVIHIDGDWLMAPTLNELESALQHHGLCDRP